MFLAVIFEIPRAIFSPSISSRQAIMGAFDPVEPVRTRARAKPRATAKPKTLAEKIPYFIGCNTSDALPTDLSVRYKDYLRANLAIKRSG